MINWSRYKPKALPTLRFPRWGNFMKRLRNWIWPWPCLFHKHRNGWITWLRWSLIQVTRNWPERQWTWRIPLVKRFVNLRHLPEGQWIWEWYWTKKCVFSLRRMMANEWGDRSGANLGIHNVQGLVFFFFLGVRRASSSPDYPASLLEQASGEPCSQQANRKSWNHQGVPSPL